MNKSEQIRAHRGWGAYLAVLVVQIVVFIAMAITWWWLQFQGSSRCGDLCDVSGMEAATGIFIAFSVVSFAVTVSTAVISRFISRDLLWLASASIGLIVIGYFPAAAVYNAATGG